MVQTEKKSINTESSLEWHHCRLLVTTFPESVMSSFLEAPQSEAACLKASSCCLYENYELRLWGQHSRSPCALWLQSWSLSLSTWKYHPPHLPQGQVSVSQAELGLGETGSAELLASPLSLPSSLKFGGWYSPTAFGGQTSFRDSFKYHPLALLFSKAFQVKPECVLSVQEGAIMRFVYVLNPSISRPTVT